MKLRQKKGFACMMILGLSVMAWMMSGCGEKAVEKKAETDVDIDLTEMSSTMVYSEVYNMVTNPDEYEGKTVRMQGMFDVYEDVDDGSFGYTCIIADATACCSQGISFIRKGDYSFPEDYPEIWSNILVEGTFDVSESGGYKVCQLVDAKMTTQTEEAA